MLMDIVEIFFQKTRSKVLNEIKITCHFKDVKSMQDPELYRSPLSNHHYLL